MQRKRPGFSRDSVKVAGRLLRYIATVGRLRLVLIGVCILVSTLAGVAGSVFLQPLIDDYVVPLVSQTQPDFAPLLSAILRLAAILLCGVAATWLYNFMLVAVSQNTLKRIRDDLFAHMQTLPVPFFDRNPYGEVMSLFTNDTDTLMQLLRQGLPQVLTSMITIISVFISMLVLNPLLTVFMVLFGGGMLFIMGKIGGRSGRYFVRQQESIAGINGYIEEMMEGQKVIKVFCHEDKVKADFDVRNADLCDASTKANTFSNILMPVMANLGTMQYILVAVVGGLLALSGIGGVTLGAIAAFLQLSRSFTMPMAQIGQQINFIVMALAGAERIFKLLDEPSESDEGYVHLVNAVYEDGVLKETEERTGIWAWKHPHHDGSVTYTPVQGDVRFFDVNFGYSEDKTVLQNISLYAKPGQKVAFVGATGAGKTTITNLINRFYDIQDGKIRYDGININKICKPDLRRSLGMVLQDTHLFTGTIRDNIRYGRLQATDEEVVRAAKLAGAHEFIQMMPQGYDTPLTGNGEGLSQGQRQLLSIARAALADPPVLILDEATSSIDTRTEAIVQRGMDALMKGRTVFVIAHRLSTIKGADVIMLLDGGEIVERGDHELLMSQMGRYYQLYTGVFELD